MTSDYRKLEDKIRQVRHRLRLITFAKGLAASVAVAVLILVLAAVFVDHSNYTSRTLLLTRVLSLAGIAAAFGWLLVRPLLRRVSEVEIARYVEERHPGIEDRLVSAIELGRRESERANPLLPLLFRDALARIKLVDPKSLFDSRQPLLSGLAAVACLAAFGALLWLGPGFLPYATLKLYADWLYPQEEAIYAIEVSPGDVQVSKGSDQPIAARLIGFDAPEVQFFSRYEAGGTWARNRMEPDRKSNDFGFLFVDLNQKVRYYVAAGNVRSREYTIDVMDVPHVEKISLVYHYPPYTGLPDKREEDTGDIAAVKGTRVEVEVRTNIDPDEARLVLDDGSSLPLKKAEGRKLVGEIRVEKDSSYRVSLDSSAKVAPDGPKYSITAMDDQPPQVAVTKPGRDKKVTKLEEVLAETKASDDFGVRSLDLHFTVNGGQENVVPLFQGKGGATKSISGTHTFFLEEYDLQPGDFVTYFARARDARVATDSDIYFLEVRPFSKDYSQSQTSGSAGGGGQADTILSARQKQIVAATWRLIRDKKTFTRQDYAENLKLVAESQRKLQEEARSLSERIERRALTERAEEFEKLSESLKKAIEAMTPAHQYLSSAQPAQAMSPEQTALQHLMRAESHFRDIQVAFGNSSSGAGEQSDAQELENLFELELDQLKNQYETLQNRQTRQANSQVDEARRKLEELARRQQQLNERNRPQSSSRFAQGGGSPASEQARLQEEVQKLARQLERLSRETENDELMQAGQRLGQAAREMQNQAGAARSSQQNGRNQAANRLNEARRMMDRFQDGNLNNEVRRFKEQVDQLGRKQEEIRAGADRLSNREDSQDGSRDRRGTARQLLRDKDALKQGLDQLQQGLHQAAQKAAEQQKKDGSQSLQAAANHLKDSGLPRRIDQGRDMLMRGDVENARKREEEIQQAISDMKARVEDAGKSLEASASKPGSPEDRLEEALNKTGDLISDLESLQRRAEEQMAGRPSDTAQQSGQNQDGQSGRQAGDGRQPGRTSSGQTGGGQEQYGGGPAGGRDAVNFGDRTPGPPRVGASGEQLRQFEREFELRYREALDLAGRLRGRPDLEAQVRDLLKRMKTMPPAKFLQDAEELARLRASVIDGFRQFEINLSKALNQVTDKDNIRLAKDEVVPEVYRKQVEDYYRALSDKAE